MGTRWTKAVQAVFLGHLAATGNVSAAARVAGVSRSQVYGLRASEPDFAQKWAEAEGESIDRLEQEARRRAVEGVEQALVYGGKFVRNDDGSVATVRHYSDRLLEFLLKNQWLRQGNRPAEHAGEQGVVQDEETADDGGSELTDDERARRVVQLLDRAGARRTRSVVED